MTLTDFKSDDVLMVFGGPYSNLRATQALVAEAERRGIPASHVICTGDVVAYCAEPEQTVRVIRDWGCHVIQGNCEQQLASGASDCACNFERGSACDVLAKGWYPFADAAVTGASRRWMAGLPATLRFRLAGVSFRVVHGGVDEVSGWVFKSGQARLDAECRRSGADVTVAGHCGLPFVARSGPLTWFNPGVIGMPANDGTPGVWYGLIQGLGEGGVELSTHRLDYDHLGAAAAMRRCGHANGYARTLVTGLWPSLDVLPEAERAGAGRPLAPCVAKVRAAEEAWPAVRMR